MDYSVLNSLNSAKKLSSADKANLFTERMSSTAHQREVADLKAAGLNPVLSANDSGATTGSAAEDDSESTFDNPIYKLIENSNKITNQTAKSLSEATTNLSKSLGKVIGTIEKKDNKADGGITYSSEDINKIASTVLASTLNGSRNNSAKSEKNWLGKLSDKVVDYLLPKLENGKKNTNENMYGTTWEGQVLRFLSNGSLNTKIRDAGNATGVDIGKTVDNVINAKNAVKTPLFSLPYTVYQYGDKITNAAKKVYNSVKSWFKKSGSNGKFHYN